MSSPASMATTSAYSPTDRPAQARLSPWRGQTRTCSSTELTLHCTTSVGFYPGQPSSFSKKRKGRRRSAPTLSSRSLPLRYTAMSYAISSARQGALTSHSGRIRSTRKSSSRTKRGKSFLTLKNSWNRSNSPQRSAFSDRTDGMRTRLAPTTSFKSRLVATTEAANRRRVC